METATTEHLVCPIRFVLSRPFMNPLRLFNKKPLCWCVLMIATLAAGCVDSLVLGNQDTERCGPSSAEVTRVIDGDTIEILNGDRIRYLLIDTPELSSNDCFSSEAKELNSELVLGKTLSFEYDEVCEDNFGRLLAFASIGDRSINETMIERGYACTLFIPPNGCLLYTSPSPRDQRGSRMPSSA